ncbi:unnamed protein product [Spirodela intermedia]|uniref:Uncharacterized protein n=1 Tax=Spirodela intermedia TaxID=51605 RepID=A0A7I8KS31_SPIIN|nr:unnamed protein product [Spirodela intermedia]
MEAIIHCSPVTRWAAVAFGAGIGLGSAYTECSYIFEGSAGKESPSSPPVPPASFHEGEKPSDE